MQGMWWTKMLPSPVVWRSQIYQPITCTFFKNPDFFLAILKFISRSAYRCAHRHTLRCLFWGKVGLYCLTETKINVVLLIHIRVWFYWIFSSLYIFISMRESKLMFSVHEYIKFWSFRAQSGKFQLFCTDN